MFVKAYAKINLFLDVISKREDGYHDLNMVMLPLELHDSIEIETSPVLKDSFITTDHIDLRIAKYNLINATLAEMRKRYDIKQNYIINVHKEIPISAGLGGGSSNAAATIKAIDHVNNLKLSEEEEVDIYEVEKDEETHGTTYEDLPDRSGKIKRTSSTDYGKSSKVTPSWIS